MAKNSIRDFSATAGSNTDIQSVNIDENCPASGINNAIRELMVDLKNVSTGAINLETPAADQLNVDNLRLDGNTISSTDTNGDITLDPNGTGKTVIQGGDSNYFFAMKGGTYGLRYNSNTSSSQMMIEAVDDTLAASHEPLFIGGSTVSLGIAGSEKVKVDASGNVLVGTTDSTQFSNSGTGNDDGVVIAANAYIDIGRQGNPGLYINRTSNDGELAVFLQDGTTVGTISCSNSGNYIYFGSSLGSVGLGYGGGFVFPTSGSSSGADNSKDFGSPSFRWDDIYATNPNINTSDQNEKQQIAALTDAEITAAKAISALFKTFKWNSAVEDKGDAARTHAGVIAQDVQAAMTAAGLDAGDYAFFISSTWWETSTDVAAIEADEEAGIEARDAYTRIDTYNTADEAPEGATQRTRLGIRYPELLAFVGAATEQRLADIETRLTALEA